MLDIYYKFFINVFISLPNDNKSHISLARELLKSVLIKKHLYYRVFNNVVSFPIVLLFTNRCIWEN